MSKTNEDKFVPKLRFPEYNKDGEWQRTTIGEVGKFYYGKSAPKWSLTSDAPTPCVRYGELYTKFDTIISEIFSRTNIDPSNLRFSKGGEILIPRVGEVPQDFAKHCCYLPFANIAIGEMISVYETKEYPIFYTHYFRTLWKQFAKVVEGQNVKNLYYVNLEPINIGRPSISEQQKIADCLSTLDEVITAESQKLVLLNSHKKGLLQNLFPQEGETFPKLRFKEFEESGEWLVKKLGEVSNKIIEKNRIGKVTNVLTNSATEGIINQRDYFDKNIANPNNLEGYYIVQQDDFIYNPRKSNAAPYGPISRNKIGTGAMSPLYYVFRFSEGDLNYLEFFFKTVYWHKHMQEIGNKGARNDRMSFSLNNLFEMPILYPTIPEQQKIASCFCTLDDLANTQSKKLEILKLHKKGLLQGLFPEINENW